MSKDFESAFKKLDIIVEEMEKGGLSLDVSLKKFEEGISLIRDCQSRLKQAEQKIQSYNKKTGLLKDINSPDESD